MNLETVIDVVFKHFPNKIIIYLREKQLFNDDINTLKNYSYLENLNVYSYEYVDKKKKIMLIRVIERG